MSKSNLYMYISITTTILNWLVPNTQFEVSEKNIRLITKHLKLSFALNVTNSAKPRNKLVAIKEFWAIKSKNGG